MISKFIYKKILLQLKLTKPELRSLRAALLPDKIACGPFIKGEKMCPTTTALSIKLGHKKFSSNNEVAKLLRKAGVSKLILFAFYLSFDLPSMLSSKILERNLKQLEETVEQLIS